MRKDCYKKKVLSVPGVAVINPSPEHPASRSSHGRGDFESCLSDGWFRAILGIQLMGELLRDASCVHVLAGSSQVYQYDSLH